MMLAVLLHDETFSWTRWPIHPSTVIGSAILLGLYYMGIGPWRVKYRWGEAPSITKPISFTAAVLVILVSLNGPLHELADGYLFSAHMIQHLLLTLLMPPLMLYGCPDWLLRALIRRTVGMRVALLLTHPMIAFAAYNVVFAGWHLPNFYEWALENHNVHIVEHLMFMVTAVMVWWPVMDPVPEMVRLATPVRLLYLFALSVPMGIVSALITLSETVLYHWYETVPRVTGLSPLDDQQLGGLIMWVPGSLFFWGAISIVYFRWANVEDREEAGHRIMLGGSAT
jgi:putative membrane protein